MPINTVTVKFHGESHCCLCPSWQVQPGAVAWLVRGRGLGDLLDEPADGAIKLRVKRVSRGNSRFVMDGVSQVIHAVRIVPKAG